MNKAINGDLIYFFKFYDEEEEIYNFYALIVKSEEEAIKISNYISSNRKIPKNSILCAKRGRGEIKILDYKPNLDHNTIYLIEKEIINKLLIPYMKYDYIFNKNSFNYEYFMKALLLA